MDVGLVFTCKCFIHAVFHHIAESSDFERIIGNRIVVVQTSDLSIVRCQYLYIAFVYQLAPVQGNEPLFAVLVDFDFYCLIFKQFSDPLLSGNQKLHNSCLASLNLSVCQFLHILAS